MFKPPFVEHIWFFGFCYLMLFKFWMRHLNTFKHLKFLKAFENVIFIQKFEIVIFRKNDDEICWSRNFLPGNNFEEKFRVGFRMKDPKEWKFHHEIERFLILIEKLGKTGRSFDVQPEWQSTFHKISVQFWLFGSFGSTGSSTITQKVCFDSFWTVYFIFWKTSSFCHFFISGPSTFKDLRIAVIWTVQFNLNWPTSF